MTPSFIIIFTLIYSIIFIIFRFARDIYVEVKIKDGMPVKEAIQKYRFKQIIHDTLYKMKKKEVKKEVENESNSDSKMPQVRQPKDWENSSF